jgi:signal transduction histidine kinase
LSWGKRMVLVWFVYGLAFFTLGLVILVYPKKDSRFDLARHIWMIGVFGIVHGLNEWLNMFLEIGGPLPLRLMDHVRVLTLSGSFFFLVQFGVTMLSAHARRRRWLQGLALLPATAWLIIVLTGDPSRRLLLGDIWCRYLLCAPGGVLTAWVLFCQSSDFRTTIRRSVGRNLAVAAVTFLAYAVLAGLFVKKADFFPATILNYETFMRRTGLPVQVFRASFAIIAAWTLIRVLDVFRLEAQETLHASEMRCARIAAAMPLFLFMTDRDTVVTFVQGKGLDVLGLHAEQIRGRPICEAFPNGQTLAQDCRRALEGREFMATAVLAGASFEIYYSTLKDGTGTIADVVGVALDIDARIQAQNELEEYRGKLERWAREAAIGVFSATVARQLVEPLTVSQLMLERAVTDLAGAAAPLAARNSVGRSLAETLKAHEILKRFMEITHPHTAATEQPVGLYQIAKRMMSVFADSARWRKLTIAVKDMDIVPLTAVSPREMEQIFYHLIQRAIDTASSDVEQKLVISCAAGEGHIELSFCDTCGGLRPRESAPALEPALGDLVMAEGSGLGLAVVKRIVTGYGGQITAGMSPDGTTTLKVRLPVKSVY